MKLVSLRFMH